MAPSASVQQSYSKRKELNSTVHEHGTKQWQLDEVLTLFELPLNDLIFKAHQVHRAHFDPNVVQTSTLLSIKTGACPEDCKYCPQSGHYHTEIEIEPLMPLDQVVQQAKQAKAQGATRFCMGAAWRSPPEKSMAELNSMVTEVKALGLETCMTLGMLTEVQAEQLAAAGLDYYNHNLDTSPEFYETIISTRTYEDRLQTLANVRNVGIKVCTGGIIGMGEEREDRAGLILQLALLDPPPESVPINLLTKVAGTPLAAADIESLEPFEIVRTIAVARILMPKSWLRLSAGRENMNAHCQALCFFAGANSVFYGEKLLTTSNPNRQTDVRLFNSLGITALS